MSDPKADEPTDPAAADPEPDAVSAAEAGPELDLNVNGGDPIAPEPVDDVQED